MQFWGLVTRKFALLFCVILYALTETHTYMVYTVVTVFDFIG